MKQSKLAYLTTPDQIWRPYTHEHVTVRACYGNNGYRVDLSLLGRCYSEYPSGPNMLVLADATAELMRGNGTDRMTGVIFLSSECLGFHAEVQP